MGSKHISYKREADRGLIHTEQKAMWRQGVESQVKTEKRALQVLVLKVGSDADTSLGTSEAEEARNEISEILPRIPSRYLDFDLWYVFYISDLRNCERIHTCCVFFFKLINGFFFLNWSITAWQYRVSFCCTTAWISSMSTYPAPSSRTLLPSPATPLGHHRVVS